MLLEHPSFEFMQPYEIRHIDEWRVYFYIYEMSARSYNIEWIADSENGRRYGGLVVKREPLYYFKKVLKNCLKELSPEKEFCEL